MNATVKPIRSPSYPSMALRDAVDSVGRIERQFRSAPVDRTVAAQLIGYSALSGPANKALAALASYGLLDRAGKGEARVTERARDILHAETQELRRARLIEAALEPALFREIRERFAGIPVPPEVGVVTFLNRQGFNPNAVRPAAKAFLETMRYLEELGASESHRPSPPDGADLSAQDGMTTKTEVGTVMNDPVVEHKGAPARSAPSQEPEELNDIRAEFFGGKVRIKALMDKQGLEELEKKIAAFKTILS